MPLAVLPNLLEVGVTPLAPANVLLQHCTDCSVIQGRGVLSPEAVMDSKGDQVHPNSASN